jgi:hypothetical protein
MEMVLTPEETAVRLGLDTGDTLRLFESGRLSGFHLGGEWRITPAALRADLDRIGLQIAPPAPIALGPRAATAFRVPPVLRPAPPKLPERREYTQVFNVRVLVENDSDYTGDFAIYLATEGSNDRWTVQHARECERVDRELLVRDSVVFDETVTFFLGALRGDLGDRLFLFVPEQPAVGEEAERVFVLQADLALRITLTNRGLLGRRRGVKIKEIPSRHLPGSPGASTEKE